MVKSRREAMKSPRRMRSGNILDRPASRGRPAEAITAAAISSAVRANIRVVIRVRPPNGKEQGDNYRNIIKIVDDRMLIFDPKEEIEPFFYHGVQQKQRDVAKKLSKNQQFMFDRVFGFESHNTEIFESTTKDLIESLMGGCNCSVFAYGATGAGKTHTMLGKDDNPGITLLTMSELFKKKVELQNERNFELAITYLEVYNETVKDLLNPGGPLQLRENGKYGVTVAGITMKRIEDSNELFELLKQGNCNRTQHPTDANAESSRSHAVFQVYMRMTIKMSGEVLLAKLSMIDLAGSERGTATGCNGVRFMEGANINKSLLALGNCINSLADGLKHVPYRDSKLTRLLKDSLGGNCQTLMIANVSPSSLTMDDTYNTLKYAARAKTIKFCIKKNVVSCEMHVEQYVKLVDELTRKVERLEGELAESGQTIESLMKENKELKLEAVTKEEVVNKEEEINAGELRERGVAEGQASSSSDGSIECLKELYSERMELLRRLCHLENCEQVLVKRIELKEEGRSRLSSLCANTPQKEENSSKVKNVITRLNKQSSGIKREISSLKDRNVALKAKITAIVEGTSCPEIAVVAGYEDARIAALEYRCQAELYQKIAKVEEMERQSMGTVVEQMSRMLRSHHLLLKGLGHLTDNMHKEYNDLVRQVQIPCSVSWNEETPDLVAASESSAEEEGPCNNGKRKLAESVTSSTSSLDRTFTLPQPKPLGITVRAEQLMAKVDRPLSRKRPVKMCNQTITIEKENKLMRKPHGTMGTSRRFLDASGDRKGLVAKSTSKVTEKVTFR